MTARISLRWFLTPFLAASLLAQTARRVDDAVLKSAGKSGDDWLTYGFTPGETRYSPLDQINASNVKRLGLAWWYDLGAGGGGQEATPLVCGRESLLDAIIEYENPEATYPCPGVAHRRISGIPLHNNTYAGSGNNAIIFQPFVLHTTDEYPLAALNNGTYVPSHVLAFRTIDQTEINTAPAPFYGNYSYGGGKLGIYSYWDTASVANNNAPVMGINGSEAPNQYEFYNYSPSRNAGNANPQEVGNEFGSSIPPTTSSLAYPYYNDFFNSGNNNGINIQNELYRLSTQGSSSNNILQVQRAIQTAFNNYISYLNCGNYVTGSTPGAGTGNNTCSPYSWQSHAERTESRVNQ